LQEKIRGAAILSETPAVTKKDKKWTKRHRLRRKSLGTKEEAAAAQQTLKPFNATSSRTNIGPDQTAKIQAAAAALRQQQTDFVSSQLRRVKPRENVPDSKTHSVFTLQPVIMSEATPAMKWANRYDRDNLKDAYLNKDTPSPAAAEKKPVDTERSLPALPKEERKEEKKEEKREEKPPVKSMVSNIPPTATAIPVKKNPPQSPVPPSPGLSPTPQSHSGRSSPAAISKVDTSAPSSTVPPAPESPALEKAGKKVSRLRAMFGMKAEGVQPTGNQLAVPANQIGRKNSLRRGRTPTSEPSPVTAEPTVAPAMEKETVAVAPPPVDEHPALSGKNPFASFDQGPLEDQPAFVPEDSPEMSEAESSVHPAIKDDEMVSEVSAPNSPEPVTDRWAQIRKNAAERAGARAKAEDVSAPSTEVRPSMDEGETSGEESKSSPLS
jgi:hypothetical protein